MSRQSVLRVTGHAYWHAAIAAAIVGALWFAGTHLRRHFHAGRHGTTSLPAKVGWLAPIQAGVFAGMEVIERLVAGAPVASVLDRRVLVIGLGLQIAVAAAIALITFALSHVAHAVGRAFAVPRVPRAAQRLWSLPAQRWPAALAVVPCGSRGPPAS